jgi:hypothetical protein
MNGGVGENTNYFTVGNTPTEGSCLGWDGINGNGTVGNPYQCSWVPANTSYNNTDLKMRRLVAQVPTVIQKIDLNPAANPAQESDYIDFAVVNGINTVEMVSTGAVAHQTAIRAESSLGGANVSAEVNCLSIGTLGTSIDITNDGPIIPAGQSTGNFYRCQNINDTQINFPVSHTMGRRPLLGPLGGWTDCNFNNFEILNFAGITGVGNTTNLNPVRFTLNRQPNVALAANEIYNQLNGRPPQGGAVLTCNNGGTATGASDSPYIWQWVSNSGTQNTALDIVYDKNSSVLTLEDPALGPGSTISQTVVVPGRTILLADVGPLSQTNVEQSVIGLSNVTFPSPPSPSLVGNNPPMVPLNPLTGVTNWFPGASFRSIISGRIIDFDNNDNLICRVYSNRGQPSQVLLSTFNLNLESVANIGYGWKWEVNFTCRAINIPGSPPTLGTVAINSQFTYANDNFTGEPNLEGFIVTNVNSTFDTSVDQYLDFTFQFQQPGNSIITNLFTVERLY